MAGVNTAIKKAKTLIILMNEAFEFFYGKETLDKFMYIDDY